MFVNVNINNKPTFLVRLSWQENLGEISIFDYETVKTWKGLIPPEQSQKTASDLDMNVADYKSQLEQSFEPSTSYQWSLIDNNLTLEEVDLLKSLPDFMAAIAKSITQLSEDLREKENLVEKLSKQNTKLIEKCKEYVKIKEDMTANLYTYFAEAFNHLKERVGVGSSTGGNSGDLRSVPPNTNAPLVDSEQEKSPKSGSENDYGSETEEDSG